MKVKQHKQHLYNVYLMIVYLLMIKVNLINSEINVISSCDNQGDSSQPCSATSTIPNVNISLHISFGSPKEVQRIDCGYTIQGNRALHINGSFEGEFPWQAIIYRASFKQITYECAGSLISKKAILTSAACISSGLPVEPDELLVFVGQYNLIKWNANYQYKSIKEVLIHPNFNFASLESDLALLKLHTNVVITDYVRPVCLWNFDHNINNLIGQEGIHPGWNYDYENYLNEETSSIPMVIVPKEKCFFYRSGLTNLKKSETLFCAGFKGQMSTCKGDDGAGLAFLVQGKWYIRGVDSISIGSQNEVVCDSSHFGAFTDIVPFIPWLNSNK